MSHVKRWIPVLTPPAIVLAAFLAFLLWGGLRFAHAQEAKPPRDLAACEADLATVRDYAGMVKGDRDQKEAVIADLRQALRVAQAELAKLREKK